MAVDSFTSSGESTYDVSNYAEITVTVNGAAGGDGDSGSADGANGGQAKGTIDVTDLSSVQIFVGGGGEVGSSGGGNGTGGFNGGGNADENRGNGIIGGGGGGASEIRETSSLGTPSSNDRIIVAGGGGGGGYQSGDNGGAGGGTNGGDGTSGGSATSGCGADQTSGFAFLDGYDANGENDSRGGGGGGWYGGDTAGFDAGGCGGSGYTGSSRLSSTSMTQGGGASTPSSDGSVVIESVVETGFLRRENIDNNSNTLVGTVAVSHDERGFVYDTSSQSDPGDVAPGSSGYSNVVSETGSFSSGDYSLNESGYTSGTKYYIRAYYYDGTSYFYSSESSFNAGETDFSDDDFTDGTNSNTEVTSSGEVQLQKNFFDKESFESGFGDWINGGNINTSTDTWTRNSGGTASNNTGPSSAQDGSYYVYVETSDGDDAFNAGDETIMELPLNETVDGEVDFYYHMYGDDIGTLYLEGYDGSSWNTIWSLSGGQGNQWNQTTQSFSGYSDLRFRNVAAGDFNGDTALDLIKVRKGSNVYLTSGTYTSNFLDTNVSRMNDVEDSIFNWVETLNGQSITVETRYSTDGGNTVSSWTEISNGGSGEFSGIGSSTSDAEIQYRVNFSSDGTDTPVFSSASGTLKAYGGETFGPVKESDSSGVIQSKSSAVVKTR